jgi:chromosome segregation ATPase
MDNETLNVLLTEEEIRQQMSDITRVYPEERKELKEALDALSKREHRAYLAVTFLEPQLLTNEDAKSYLRRAMEAKKNLIKEDKIAIQQLEIESEKIAYELAKFNADTSDKQFAKLDRQLSFFQSTMKFTGSREGT